MMQRAFLITALGLLTVLFVGVVTNAQLIPPAGIATGDTCRAMHVESAVGRNTAGDILFCVRVEQPQSVGSNITATATLTGPALSGTTSVNVALNDATGCTILSDVSENAITASGTAFTRRWNITMDSEACTGYFRAIMAGGSPTTIYIGYLPLDLITYDAASRVDNQVRLCDGSAFGADCASGDWLLQFTSIILPIIALVLLIVWGEVAREPLLWILVLIVSGVATIALWNEAESLRFVVIMAGLIAAIRAYTDTRDMGFELKEIDD